MPFLTGITEMKNKGKDKERTERNELSASWLLLTVSFISCSHHTCCTNSRDITIFTITSAMEGAAELVASYI